MILDILQNADAYEGLNPHFGAAFAFLRRQDLADLPEGRHEVQGDDVFAVVAKGVGRSPEDALLETHDRYIDIQFVLKGTDSIGWKPRADLSPAVESSEENDVCFYSDAPTNWASVGPNSFGIYFPDDGHMPMISDEPLHKVIVKVAVADCA